MNRYIPSRPIVILLLLILAMAAPARAASPEEEIRNEIESLRADARPAFLAARAAVRAATPAARARALVKVKLAGSGVPDAYVDQVFDDPRAKLFPEIPGKFGTPTAPPPPVPYARYRKYFITPANIAAGVQFVRDHRALLDAVTARSSVDGALLTALVSIETRYGTAAGTYPVFDALNTIVQQVPARSNWAARETAEFLKMTYAQGQDAHAVLGSYAGAFGFVQFEPSTYNAVAVDFDGDGQRRLDQWPDALGSCAHYLSRAGYDASAPFTPDSKIGLSLFAYNHSDNYVRVILELRGEIQSRLP
ncbi:MAG: lytic murein transglycosylase [Elusimicrobia bacterium]|nr:lytic murein transglycosylase [Elusimicrobiota bacterium]MDE2509672.1 lytic murein transglycosylase [Elusimicrobiota bacterium]